MSGHERMPPFQGPKPVSSAGIGPVVPPRRELGADRLGAWAALKARPDGQWAVSGGAMDREFFFETATKKDLRTYLDPEKWQFIFCPEGVRIGTIVTIENGRVVWPAVKPVTKEADYYETVVETALASGNTGAFTDAEADAWARNGSVLDRRWAATVAKAKASSEAITAERDRARKSLRELAHWSAGTVEYDAAKRTALQVLADAYLTSAKPLSMVPRGHCGRCDRCGSELVLSSLGCSLGNCSLRPVPSRRDACAGCGAPFETTPETP